MSLKTKIAVIVVFLATGFDCNPWGTTSSALGPPNDTDFDKLKSSAAYKFQNSTEQNVTRSGDHLKSTTMSSSLVSVGAGVGELSQDFYESPKPDSGALTKSEPPANVGETIMSTNINSDSKSQTQESTNHHQNTVKSKGMSYEALKSPECSSCPDDQSFCCNSGCCGRLAFWMEPPAVYYVMIWIVAIILILGITIYPCARNKKVVKSQSGAVVFQVKNAKVKGRSLGSSSTCESVLSDEPDRAEDVFETEPNGTGSNETTYPVRTEHCCIYTVEYECRQVPTTTDESACILDSSINLDQDLKFKF